jgi:hypothetical protein
MIRFGILPALLAAATLAGCPGSQGNPHAPSGNPGAPGSDANGPAGPPRYIPITSLRMVTIEVPVGLASGSEEIWSYVDEEPVAIGRSAILGRNGFRIGLGRASNWDDVVKIMRRLTGRAVQESHINGIPGSPQQIILKERQPIQTIFLSNADRTLSGADYPPGDNLVSLMCTLNEDDPNSLILTGLPQVRSTYRKPEIIKEETGLVIVDRPTMFPFTGLTFQITVPKDNFILVGPGAESRRPSSLGHCFLVHQKDGVEFETLIVITPRIIRQPVP